jgi:hypothetical protein
MSSLSTESLETTSSPYINRFLQPDTIIQDLSNPQSWNRYSYVTNRPVNFNDPSGHRPCGDGEEVDCSGKLKKQITTVANCSGAACRGGDPSEDLDTGDEASCPVNDPNCDLSINNQTNGNPNAPLCEQLYSHTTCQKISGLLSVGVLTLDSVAAIGSGIFAILMAIAQLGGPIGVGVVEAAYLIANPVEGWMGGASFFLTAINDFLVTGGSYIANNEVVLSSDVTVSGIFAIAGAIDPEPYGDTLMNGTAAIYDLYRLTGGDILFNLHIGPSGWYLSQN